MTDYTELTRQLEALTEGVPHRIANLSNAAALLYHTLEDLNWAGFYLMENGMLVLGPFQGRPACIEIPVGRGVCGTAVAQDKTQRVPDVHQFPGHIACDGASRSEIVIPIHAGGQIAGVLDLDSPVPDRFSPADQAGLEGFVRVLERNVFGNAPEALTEYCKVEIFIPESHLPPLQHALQAVDAGHIGNYDCCLSYSRVTSCWRPLAGSVPYLGAVGEVSTEPELKVEVTCPTERVETVVAAVKVVHPYEEPVINVIPLWRTGL